MESDPHPGRPVMVRTHESVECVQVAVNKNCCLILFLSPRRLEFLKVLFLNFNSRFGYKLCGCEIDSRMLMEDQKDCQLEIVQYNTESIRNNPDVLKKVKNY